MRGQVLAHARDSAMDEQMSRIHNTVTSTRGITISHGFPRNDEAVVVETAAMMTLSKK